MAITFRPLSPPSDEEMLALHDLNPGVRVERTADGRLLMSPTGARSSHRNGELTRQLGNFCAEQRVGRYFDSSAGFVLPDTSLFGPDGAFVTNERWNALTPEQQELYFPGAPDAALEIVSRTDDPRDQRKKCELFARNGSRLVVLIDPYRASVERWVDGEHEVLGDVATVDCSPAIPGFVLDVRAILLA